MSHSKIVISCLTAIILLAGCMHSEDFSQSVRNFQEKNAGKGGMALHFYPGTIGMLNPNRDSAFNSLVKDIKKLKIATFKTDSAKTFDVSNLISNIRKEAFVDLIQMKQNNRQFQIFLRKKNNKPKEFIGLVKSDNDLIVIDLLGSIPMSSLPALMSGNINLAGFTSVFNNSKSQFQSKQKHGKHSSDK